jgi:hypothetical protein
LFLECQEREEAVTEIHFTRECRKIGQIVHLWDMRKKGNKDIYPMCVSPSTTVLVSGEVEKQRYLS